MGPNKPPKPIRGAIAQQVVVATPADPYMTLRAAAEYTGLTKTGLLRAVNAAPDLALPHYRVGNKILVRRSEVDRWIEGHRHRGRPSLEKALAELGLGKRGA